MLAGLTSLAVSHPRKTLALTLLLCMFAAAGLPRLKTEVGYRGILGDHHPSVERLDAMIDTYGGGLPVYAVWRCGEDSACSSALDATSLAMAADVASVMAAHPLVRSVQSPATSPLLVQTESGFDVRTLFEDGEPVADLADLAELAREDPIWSGELVSADGRVGAIVLQLASSDSRTTWTVVPVLQRELARFEARGFRFYLAGDPVDFAVAGGALEREMPRIVPVMVALIAAASFWLFRSWWLTSLALATTGVSVLVALGAMGWLGWRQNELTQALAPSILVVSVCYAIHLLAEYATRINREHPHACHAELLRECARTIGGASVMAALTTAAGFLSFVTSGFASFIRFGVIAALGTLAALLTTFTLLPALLIVLRHARVAPSEAEARWDPALALMVSIAERRSRLILVVCSLIATASVIGITRLVIDVDEHELFGSNNPVVKWAEFVDTNLRRSDTLEIELVVPEGRSALEPDAMRLVSDLHHVLPTILGFGRARSLLDSLQRVRELLHGGDSAYSTPAPTLDENAQLLSLLDFDPTHAREIWLDFTQRRLRISVEAEPAAKSQRIEMLAAARAAIESRLPLGFSYSLSGPFSLYFDLVDEMHRTQLNSFATSALTVGALFALFLWLSGSPPASALRWAMLGMIPNVLPILATLGAMGLAGIPLDVGTIMVAAIVLGIAVDDTIHLLTRYRAELARGLAPREAIRASVRGVGRPVVTTALVLAGGSFALMLSSWQSIASFGFLSGISILVAVLADLFLLPALILGVSGGSDPPEAPVARSAAPASVRRGIGLSGFLLCVLGFAIAAPRESSVQDPLARPACWLLASGYPSLWSSASGHCPIASGDRVDGGSGAPTFVQHAGHRVPIEIPALRETRAERGVRIGLAWLSGLWSLAAATFLLLSTSAPAGIGAFVSSMCLALLAFSNQTEPTGTWAQLPHLAACALLPAGLGHLLLHFPSPGRLAVGMPLITRACYVAAVFSGMAMLWGMFRYPVLWLLLSRTTAAISVLLAAGLLIKCALTLRESNDALERARSTAALRGGVILAVLGGLATAIGRETGAVDLIPAAAAIALPLPISLALLRFQINDVRPHLRRAGAYLLFLLGSAGVASLLFFVLGHRYRDSFHLDPTTSLLALFALVIASAVVGHRAWRVVARAVPSVDARLNALDTRHRSRLETLDDPERCADFTAEILREGLHSRGVDVYLGTAADTCCAGRSGYSAELTPPALEAAQRLTARRELAHLALEQGQRGPDADRLRREQVEIVAPLSCRDALVGFATVREADDGLPFTSRELIFVTRVCSRAAISIQNGLLAAELMRSERFATIGQIGAGLAHDLGKPLSVAYQRAQLLLRTEQLTPRVREQIRSMAAVTDEALTQIDALLERGSERTHEPKSSLVDVLERAVTTAQRLHAPDCVLLRPTPGLPEVSSPAALARALANLIDNGIEASAGSRVEVYATANADSTVIEVVDRGSGMDAAALHRAFEPFFTTRARHGGRGLGLSTARNLVEGMGGTLVLESAPGKGTTARISLPLRTSTDSVPKS